MAQKDSPPAAKPRTANATDPVTATDQVPVGGLVFGKGDIAQAGMPKAESAASSQEAAEVADAPAGVSPPKKKDAPSKTILLAKLRDRLKDSSVKK